MADFISFDEGEKYLLTHGDGLPATCFFALSTNMVDNFATTTTLAGGFNEITGTGYARQGQAAPTPTGGQVAFSPMAWSTGSATNWPAGVKSVLLCNSSSNVGQLICAWNLVAGGTPRNMSAANTTETVVPSFTLSSVVTSPPPGGGGGTPPPGGSAYDQQVKALNPTFYVTGDTTDQGGGNHTIVNHGATAVVIMPNNDVAWQFNGSSNYLEVQDATVGDMSVSKTGFLTVECWFQLPSNGLNQPSAFTDSGAEIYTQILGKEDWSGDTVNCPATGLSSEYVLRYYNANSPTWTPINGVGNGSGALCYYHFNRCGGTGSGHDDRSAQGNGPTGQNNPKVALTWYHAVGLYTNQSSTVNGVSYPNGYVQLYLNGHSVNSFDGGPIIDTFSAESFHAVIQPTFTGVPLTIGGTDVHAASKLMFLGAVGKVATYPFLLSPAQITANYNLMLAGSGGGGGGTPTLPAVTGVFPPHGGAAGGTQIAVTGSNFTGATSVKFGGSAASYSPVSGTQLNATAPAGTAGNVVDITVTTPQGISALSSADQYTYDAAVTPPVGNDAYDTAILADSPVLYLSGGDLTTIQGTNHANYDMTNHNVTTSSAVVPNGGNAYHFNGTTAYLWIPDPGIAHPGDVSLSIVPHGGAAFGALSVEYWVQLDTLVMPHPSPGMEGGTNFMGKCSDISPPVDAGKPATDGCEWEMRYFNADASNTNSGSNPYGDFCGYAFNSTGGLGAGFDDHIYDITNTSTGKTTAEWFYFCIVYTKDPNYNPAWVSKNDGSVTMYAGVFGDVNFTGFQKTSTPMNGGSTTGAVISPSRTTTPLTIGTAGWYSDGTVANHFNPQLTFDPGFFQGKLAKIAIYDYALTSTQTHAHYQLMHP